MTTRKFITGVREKLFQTFLELELCKYCFDRLTNTHYFLVPPSVYNSQEFSSFDYTVNREAFDLGIQGLLCFMTDATLFDFEQQETYYNRFNNEVILKNLVHMIPPSEFFHLYFSLADVKASFNTPIDNGNTQYAGENNYAVAA
jgi:hypothetical protein